jgi:hypothetical protein
MFRHVVGGMLREEIGGVDGVVRRGEVRPNSRGVLGATATRSR